MASDPSLLELIVADIDCYIEAASDFQVRNASLLRRISVLITPSLMCCLLIRLAHAAHRRGWSTVARGLSRVNVLAHKMEVDPASSIGPGLYIPHPSAIILRGRAGRGLTLYSQAIVGPIVAAPTFGDGLALCPVLGDNVTLGAFAIVVGPISVGDRAQIGPGVVVMAPVSARSKLVAPGSIGRALRP
jgi:serine O-acetyltransferase